MCVVDTKCVVVTRYTCLRVCWIPRAAPELWFLKDVLDEMTIPRKKTHYALDETYVFEPKLFLKGSALVVVVVVRCQIQIPRFARETKTLDMLYKQTLKRSKV